MGKRVYSVIGFRGLIVHGLESPKLLPCFTILLHTTSARYYAAANILTRNYLWNYFTSSESDCVICILHIFFVDSRQHPMIADSLKKLKM